MGYFEYRSGKLIIKEDEVLGIPVFKKLLDRTDDSNVSERELIYIYLTSDYGSPLFNKGFNSEQIHEEALRLLNLESVDSDVLNACDTYCDINEGSKIKLLKATLEGLGNSYKIVVKLNDLITLKLNGIVQDAEIVTLIDQQKLLLSFAKEIPTQIKSLDAALDQAKKEASTLRQARGNTNITTSMLPKDKR